MTDKSQAEQFAEVMNAPAFKDAFDDKYIEALGRRRDVLSARAAKVQAIQMTIIVILALALLSVHLSVSVFGFSTSDSKNARELLLVVASTVQMFHFFQSREEAYIRGILQEYVKLKSKGNEVARRALAVRYGIGAGAIMEAIKFPQTVTRRQGIIMVIAAIGMLGWFLMFVGCLMLIQIAAVVDILRNPTISLTVSILVALYVVFVDIATFSFGWITNTFGGLRPPDAKSA